MLAAAGCVPECERSSRTEPLTEPEAQTLLRTLEKVVICRGRKTLELGAGETKTDDLKGPTGGFRAPLLHLDDTLVVGFNRDVLTDLFG